MVAVFHGSGSSHQLSQYTIQICVVKRGASRMTFPDLTTHSIPCSRFTRQAHGRQAGCIRMPLRQ
jgi:hypothetical protein